MSVWDWLTERLTKKQQVRPEPSVAPGGLSPGGLSADSIAPTVKAKIDAFAAALGLGTGRDARYSDFDLMDHGDIAAMLDAVCDAALMFDETNSTSNELEKPLSFKIQVEKPNHRKVIEEVLTQTRLKEKLWQYTRNGLKYGDLFLEPLVDRSNTLVGIQSYHPKSIEVYVDEKNRLKQGIDPDLGVPLPYVQRNTSGEAVAGWAPWEMIHWKWLPSDLDPLSEKSLLDDYRPDWKKLNNLEMSMVVARVVRAYTRQVHYLDYTGLPDAEQRKAFRDYVSRTSMRLRQQRTGQMVSPDEDLYMTTGYVADSNGRLHPRLNKIDTIDPNNSGISDVRDIEYTRRKLFSRVPPEIIGVQSNNTKDVSAQDIAFGRLVVYTQQRMEALVRDVIDLACLLAGYEVGSVKYTIFWPRNIVGTNWKLADAAFRQSMAMRNYVEMGATRRWVFSKTWNMTNEEIDAMFDEYEKEMDRFGPLDPGTAAAKATAGNNSSE